jgi:hypothetical protein
MLQQQQAAAQRARGGKWQALCRELFLFVIAEDMEHQCSMPWELGTQGLPCVFTIHHDQTTISMCFSSAPFVDHIYNAVCVYIATK